MAHKRQNGEGSWGKKNIKGVTYFYYRDAQQHYTYGKSQKEVKEKLEKAKEKKEKIEHLVPDDDKLTVGDYMKVWLYERKYHNVGIDLESTTFDCYENSLTKRLYGYPIADLQIASLDEKNLSKHLKKLAETYARGSIKKTWQVIRLALTDQKFELYNHVPKINYSDIRVPKESLCAKKAKDIEFTSNEDMETLFAEALKKKPTGAYVYGNAARLLAFIMYSGLREAEACGLQWKDIDMKNDMVSINQTYNIIKERDDHGNAIGTKYIIKAPKSESSTATIPFRKKGKEILEIMEEMYPNHKPTDFVFLTDTNTPFQKRHVLHTLTRMLKNTGLDDKGYTVHALRHGYGSILIQEGVDLMTVSKLLRHKDIETTANIYIKVTPHSLKDKLAAVDNKEKTPV